MNRILFVGLVIGIIFSVAGIWAHLNAATPAATVMTGLPSNLQRFGTNLGLYGSTDQFLTSSATRTDMQSVHVQFVRMPIRTTNTSGDPLYNGTGCPSTWEDQAAQYIHDLGMVPLITLKYGQLDPQSAGICVVQHENAIFGSAPVYYEFGNERDLKGQTQEQYTAEWNSVIANVAPVATNGIFGGPTVSHNLPAYIAYFIHNAVPRAAFADWHEYTCGNSDSAQTCIDNIAHWSAHIQGIRSAIQANGDTVPPLFITEWNYDPVPPSPDPRVTPSFMDTFTRTAIAQLENDGVTASNQFEVTGNDHYQLIDSSGNLTAEGTALSSVYDTTADTDGDGYADAAETALGKSPTTYCGIMRADINGDGFVNGLDLNIVAKYWTQNVPPAPERVDQNSDEQINGLDLNRLSAYWTMNVSACP